MNFNEIINNIDKYELIGEGGNREVYDIGNELVLKVAVDYNTDIERSIAVNRKEYDVYHKAEDKAYLCPVEWISEDGMYLVMKNANDIAKPSTRISFDEFIEHLIDMGYDKQDAESPSNWVGYYLVDYGWSV